MHTLTSLSLKLVLVVRAFLGFHRRRLQLRHLAPLALAAAAGLSAAESNVPVAQIARVVTAFAKTQGCMVTFDKNNIVQMEFEGEQAFIVLYSSDVGCSGGSGMTRPAFAVLSKNYQGELFIRPQFSAPTQTSESLPRLIERIYLKEGRLWYAAKDFDARQDALCCPSLRVEAPVRFKGHQWADDRDK